MRTSSVRIGFFVGCPSPPEEQYGCNCFQEPTAYLYHL